MICQHICLCTTLMPGACRGQMKVLCSLELEPLPLWALGMVTRSSGRAVMLLTAESSLWPNYMHF